MTKSSVKSIHVVDCSFTESSWRDAVLNFLFGVWGNQPKVMVRPQIIFDDLATLRLTLVGDGSGQYTVINGQVLTENTEKPPEFLPHQILCVADGQVEVQDALVRFVKNDGIQMVEIACLDIPVSLFLWKKSRRGQIGVLAGNRDNLLSLSLIAG